MSKIIFSVLFVILISLGYSQGAFGLSQSTDNGILDVDIMILDKPSSGTNLNVDFVNPHTQKIQQHIDYTVLITKDGTSIFGPIPLTHTSKGSVSIPVEFRESGDYTIDITIQGILFQPIPTESVSFTVPVTVKTPVPQPTIEIVCHQGTSINVTSTDISKHFEHGDQYGECKTEQITEPIEITELEITEIIIPETTQEEKPASINATDDIVSEIPKTLTPQETDSFIDLLIKTMNSIFNFLFNIEDNPRLEQWASDVIEDRVQRTEDKIYSQLEETQDISQIKTDSDKILHSTEP